MSSDVIQSHTITQGQETQLDIEFKAYPHVSKQAIRWNIYHTDFKRENWKYSMAKDNDAERRTPRGGLTYDEMVKNKVFRISDDMNIDDKQHSLQLFVSPGYQYDEYDSVGDELWIVEMVVKVKFI